MSKKNEKNDEVVEATNNLPAVVIDFGDEAGAGFEDVGQDEIGIPYLKVLQAQSPEVIGPEGRIDGAVAGNILNTGSMELAENVTLVPVLRQHVYVEWRPRKKGGGIVAVHQKNDAIVAAALAQMNENIEQGVETRKPGGGTWRYGEMYTEAGNDLVETFYLFCVVLEDDQPTGYAVLPFSSTQIKKYKKQFMNRAGNALVANAQGKRVRPPMFAHRIAVGSVQEQNDDGTWFNYDIKFAVNNNVIESVMTPDHPAFQAGRDLKSLIESGAAKADTDTAGGGATDAGDDSGDEAF